MKQYQYLKKVLVLVTLFVVQFVAAQYEIPEKPDFQTSVYDYVNLLSSTEKSTLENKLIKYSDSTSTQIVVAIIKSTQGEYINKLAVDWAHEWGIGQKGKDNGVFLLLARDDRKITIQTGYGVEHLLTDLMSRRIIETDIIPHFKRNNYYAGLDSGTNAVFKVLTGAYKGTRQEEGGGTDFGFIIFIIFLIIFFILVTRGNRGNGGGSGRGYRDGRRNRDIFETIILSNSGRGGFGGGFGGSSGGGFGGSSGGGFGGGFGGGGFGGGGATGSW